MSNIMSPHYKGFATSYNAQTPSRVQEPSRIHEGVPGLPHSVPHDYSDEAMAGWFKAGESLKPKDFGPISDLLTYGEIFYTEGREIGLKTPGGTPLDLRTQIWKTSDKFPINATGRFAQGAWQTKQDYNELLFRNNRGQPTQDAIQFLDDLTEEGVSLKNDVNEFGYEHAPNLASTYNPGTGLTSLLNSTQLNVYTEEFMQKHGLTGKKARDAFKQYVFKHELTHVGGIRSERRVEQILLKHYKKLAKKHAGTYQGAIYDSIVKECYDAIDRTTPSGKWRDRGHKSPKARRSRRNTRQTRRSRQRSARRSKK